MFGGDVSGSIFSKILSIGYELETSGFTKASLLGDVLLITDLTNSLYKSDLKRINDGLEPLYPNELVEIDLYTTESLHSHPIKIENSEFLIATDIAVTKFTKHLSGLCKDEENAYKEDQMENKMLEDELSGYDVEEEDYTDFKIEILQEFKNTLYKFKTDDNEYSLQFNIPAATDCGVITNTEWIFTFFRPAQNNENIILDTFITVIRNLKHHLDSLTYTEGILSSTVKGETEDIPKPLVRKLYNLPGTNLHYLQTYFIDEEETVDDVCVVPQMTFSCHVSDLIDIVKSMVIDSLEVINNEHIKEHEQAESRLELINRIENIINDLIREYNKTTDDVLEDDIDIRCFKNYLFLFLFKISRYFNGYLEDVKKQKAKLGYLKDRLFINSRHSNYNLYVEMKKCFERYYIKKGYDVENIIRDIQKVIIRPTILLRILDYFTYVRKGAFNFTHRLDKTNKNYGDPKYSMASYFDFFESPLERVEEEGVLARQYYHDWFYYEKTVDIYSTTSLIENNIILTEMRMFGKMLSLYVNSFLDENLLTELYDGACNRATGRKTSYTNAFTVRALTYFADAYDLGVGKPKIKSKKYRKSAKRKSAKRSKKKIE